MHTRFLLTLGLGASLALLLGMGTEGPQVALTTCDGASRTQLVAWQRYEDRLVMFADLVPEKAESLTSSEKMTSRSL